MADVWKLQKEFMTNYWLNNFDKIRNEFAAVFNALERAFKKFDVDFYLIGAQSRDVWTSHLNVDRRKTKDIDYVVYVPERGVWKQLNEYLTEEEKFERDTKQPYRFYLDEFTIDLIPFGGIAENDEITLDNPTMELSVYGCTEVTEEAVVLNESFKVITLPGLCVMKLIAFSEKPGRVKDWDDFLFILKNYQEIAGTELFDGQHEDLVTEDFEFNIVSARLLGRHMHSILNKNEKIKHLVLRTVINKLQRFSPDEIDQMYKARDKGDKQIELLKSLSEVARGIMDK